jgi:hypothetical protein
MRALRDTDKIQSQYCSKSCGQFVQDCPYEKELYTSPTFFTCNTGFFDLYYKCYDENDLMNNEENVGMFFSGFLNSHTIIIPLKHEYTSYAISVWIFHEFRFRNLTYLKKTYDLIEQTIFLTDNIRVKFGSYNNSYNYYSDIETSQGTLNIPTKFNLTNWNHLLITIEENQAHQYNSYASYDHYLLYYHLKPQSKRKIPLNYILFCNKDNLTIYSDIGDRCKNISWYDAHYRKLQIFDLSASSRYAVFYSFKWENGENYMLRHQYITTLSSMIKNVLKDTIGNSDGYLPILTRGDTVNNPDNANFINYESYFTPFHAFTDKIGQEISTYSKSGSSTSVSFNNKGGKCLFHCNNRCLKCKEPYAQFNGLCYGLNKTSTSNKAYTVYKNPGKNMPDKLYLDIKANRLKNFPSVTIFFFINIYGFTGEINAIDSESREIIIFDELSNFYFGYDPILSKQSLFFEHNGRRIFEHQSLKEEFGHWIPVSIAAFRESDRTFQLNMVQAAILKKNLEYIYDSNSDSLTYEMPYLDFTEFAITNKWVGLLRDVKVYDDFIINAWGAIRNPNDDSATNPFVYIPLYDNNYKCLRSIDYISSNDNYEPICVRDYNPYDYLCGDPNNQYIDYYQGEKVSYGDDLYDICMGSCGTYHYIYRECLGSVYHKSGSVAMTTEQTAAAKHENWLNFYPILSRIDNERFRVQCGQNGNFNLNRLGKVLVSNIKNPDIVWNMDFWFYTQSYRNVYIPLISPTTIASTTPNSWKKINFKNVIVEWDFILE